MNQHGFYQRVLALKSFRSGRWNTSRWYSDNSQNGIDSRNKWTNFWIPSRLKRSAKSTEQDVDSNQLLVEAGFLRQPYSGIFHLLPLGLRVQDKLERLIDKHMDTLGASKLSLSSISSQELWERSGRLATNPDLFKFQDRWKRPWMLSPTHEEEITSLVGSLVHSYRDMPVRLYQISRKYRDEPRPRQGLLRGREFLMKDLYTFDHTSAEALKTYEAVKKAYCNLFDELKLLYLVAKADSGNMGGSLSHEFHFPSSKGEDEIISCSGCDYVKNEELVDHTPLDTIDVSPVVAATYSTALNPSLQTAHFAALSKDKRTLIMAYAPRRKDLNHGDNQINPYAIKASVKDVDLVYEDPQALWEEVWTASQQSGVDGDWLPSIKYVFDQRLPQETIHYLIGADLERYTGKLKYKIQMMVPTAGEDALNILKAASGDKCPDCEDGQLSVQKAVEVGHTFHLGTRYSQKLGAAVKPREEAAADVPMEMGCHGIGVSRLIAAVASALADAQGLNWPRAIAPFQVVIIPRKKEYLHDAELLYDEITSGIPNVDAIIDDRDLSPRDIISRLFDADTIGFPVIVVLGRDWPEGEVEIQCRRLDRVKGNNVPSKDVKNVIKGLLELL